MSRESRSQRRKRRKLAISNQRTLFWTCLVLAISSLGFGILSLLQRPDFPLFRLRPVSGVVKHAGYYRPPGAKRGQSATFLIVFEPGEKGDRYYIGATGLRAATETLTVGVRAESLVYGDRIVEIRQGDRLIFDSHEASVLRYRDMRVLGVTLILASLSFGSVASTARKQLGRMLA